MSKSLTLVQALKEFQESQKDQSVEDYTPPKSGIPAVNFRRQQNLTTDGYRTHFKTHIDFNHYLENCLDGKTFEISGDILYYKRILKLYKDQCNGLRLDQIIPRVLESILQNRKDDILQYTIPDFRHLPHAERQRLKAERDQNRKQNKEAILPLNRNKPTVKDTSYYQIKWDEAILHEFPTINKFKIYVNSVLNGTEIKIPISYHKFRTRTRHFIHKLQDPNFACNAYFPKDQLAYLEQNKDELQKISWKSIGNQNRDNMNSKIDTKPIQKTTKLKGKANMAHLQTPEVNAKRIAGLKAAWARRKAKENNNKLTIQSILDLAKQKQIEISGESLSDINICYTLILELLTKINTNTDTDANLETNIQSNKNESEFSNILNMIRDTGIKQFHIEF